MSIHCNAKCQGPLANNLPFHALGTVVISFSLLLIGRASLIAPFVMNPPAMSETPVQFLVGKIHWTRDRLPTPVFLGFLCDSAGKESACSAGDLGLIPGLGRSPGEGDPWRRERLPTPEFLPGEFLGLYSSWCLEESDMTAQLSFSLIGTLLEG